MKYGAPEEIRTPDPQIRSLTRRGQYRLIYQSLAKTIVFRKFAKSLILAALVSACSHTPGEVAGGRDDRAITSPKPRPSITRWTNPDGTKGIRIDDSCMFGCPLFLILALAGCAPPCLYQIDPALCDVRPDLCDCDLPTGSVTAPDNDKDHTPKPDPRPEGGCEFKDCRNDAGKEKGEG